MMSLNTGWLQQRADQTLGGTIVIKSEDQTHLSQAIVIKPDEQHQHLYLQTTDASGQQRGLIKLQPAGTVLSSSKCSMFTQTEPTNRFTQTENTVNGTLVSRLDNNRQEATIAMFEQSVQPQVYIATPLEKKDGDKTEFPLCYNVNMIQKVPLHTTSGQTVGTAVMDDKGCYRLDVGQSFSYNYVVNNVLSAATYKCDICGLAFSHPSLLTQHKRVHNQNSSSQQQQCEVQQSVQVQVQVQQEQQQQQQQQTMSMRQYDCDICGMSFMLSGELKSHKNALHKDHQVTMSEPSPKASVGRTCEVCGTEVSITNAQGLKKKKIRCTNCYEMTNGNSSSITSAPPVKPGHHPVKKRGTPCVTKCQTCNGSGLIFIGAAKLKQTTPPDKVFECNICHGTFSRYSSLWSHKRLHSGDKPFKCDTCGLCFAKAAYLKNHHRVHTGEKPFKCATCGMQFSQSPHLKNHERIHSGERPYQCEVCDKTFARHSTLWNHRRIHTGEKPYRCNVCDSKFNQATHLKNHAKVHTGEKPFKCETCEVAFADRFALKRHRSVHEKYARVAQQQQQQDVSLEDKKLVTVTFAPT